MSWAKIASGVGVVVFGGIMLAVGKVWGNSEGEESRKEMNAENERLRQQLRSVLHTCENEIAKKHEEIAWLESVIDHLMTAPPSTRNELALTLQSMNLTNSQFELVMAHASPIYEG